MKAVVGLGNPGIKYSDTKHNVGFMLADLMVKQEGISYRNDFRGKIAEGKWEGDRVFFLKPYTYMNLSGLSVAQLAGYYKIVPEDILILHDDMDIPLGRMRLRAQGGSGGHNGIKSIISELNTQNFWRLRIGVGRPKEEGDVVNHVLSSFQKEERKVVEEVLDRAAAVVRLWIKGQGEEAMRIYNKDS